MLLEGQNVTVVISVSDSFFSGSLSLSPGECVYSKDGSAAARFADGGGAAVVFSSASF